MSNRRRLRGRLLELGAAAGHSPACSDCGSEMVRVGLVLVDVVLPSSARTAAQRSSTGEGGAAPRA